MGNVVELNNIIKKAISEFGKNIITEVRFVNILSDYGAFELCPSYKFVIKELIHAGFMRKLLNEVAASKDYDVAKSDLMYQILQILPIQEQVLDHVLNAILSCYLKNPSLVRKAPQGCSDSSSVAKVTSTKPKYITLSDLEQIGEFILGKTSLLDIKRKGYVMSNTGNNRTLTIPGNYGNLSNEYNLNSKLNVYSMYSWQRFPPKWKTLGFSSELSYKEWGTLLKDYGFTVKKENEVNLWGIGSATKDITYISHDNSIELKITYTSRESTIFDNDKRGTFDSLTAKALKQGDSISATNNQSKIDKNNVSNQCLTTNAPARAGKYWTAQEEKKLERLYYKNYTIHQMADELQRSLGSICGRLTSVLGYDNWSTTDTVIDERGYHVCIDIETKQEDTSLSPTIQSSQPSRKGKHWTKAEEEKLQRLYNQGNNVTDIAKKLGRTPLSVCGRLTNIIGDKWTTNDTRIDERGFHVLIE